MICSPSPARTRRSSRTWSFSAWAAARSRPTSCARRSAASTAFPSCTSSTPAIPSRCGRSRNDSICIAHALHRRLEERNDDRARGLLPLLLRPRREGGRRRERGRLLHRDHRSWNQARRRGEDREVPSRLPQRSEHWRTLLRALVLRHGSGGGCGLRRPNDSRPRPEHFARQRANHRRRKKRKACASEPRSPRSPRAVAIS